MPEIFFTADTHFGHAAIIRHCRRPFRSVAEMDYEMINRWNEVVGPDDVVYHLGDFGLHEPGSATVRLNGHVRLVPGNHDNARVRRMFSRQPNREVLSPLEVIPVGSRKLVLCHYQLRTWPGSRRGNVHLFGHSHGMLLPPHGVAALDVGVDCNNFRPVPIREIWERMAKFFPDLHEPRPARASSAKGKSSPGDRFSEKAS